MYPERVEAMWSCVSAESRAVVASLLRPDPAERLVRDARLRRMHMHTIQYGHVHVHVHWVPARRPLRMHVTRVCICAICARAWTSCVVCTSQGLDDLLSLPWVDCTTSPPSGTSSRLLVEAHEALNVWHDGFIFDGVCDTLAQMAVEADAPGPTGPTKA